RAKRKTNLRDQLWTLRGRAYLRTPPPAPPRHSPAGRRAPGGVPRPRAAWTAPAAVRDPGDATPPEIGPLVSPGVAFTSRGCASLRDGLAGGLVDEGVAEREPAGLDDVGVD